jgi:hypothetical protein
MSTARKAEIRDAVIETLNSMGSRFFQRSLTLNTTEEAAYAFSLWSGKVTLSADRLTVTFYAR